MDLFTSVLSRLDKRFQKYFQEKKETYKLPTNISDDSVKCKDFNIDIIDFKKLKVKTAKERKSNVVKPINTSGEYCDMV
jgi:hypothetical protein